MAWCISSIVPIEMRHIESLSECVMEVARERRFLSIVDGFTLDQSAAWVAADRLRGNPFLVALDQDRVVVKHRARWMRLADRCRVPGA